MQLQTQQKVVGVPSSAAEQCVSRPASPAGAAGVYASLLRAERLSWSKCSKMLSCAGVWEPSFTVPVKYKVRDRLKTKACVLCCVNRRAMVGLLVLNKDTGHVGNGESWWKGR